MPVDARHALPTAQAKRSDFARRRDTKAATGKVLGAIAWSLAIIVVAAPLAVRMYRRKV